MNPWEQPLDIRIAAAQAHLQQRVLEAQGLAAHPRRAADGAGAQAGPRA